MKRLKKRAESQVVLDIKLVEEWVTGSHNNITNDEIKSIINRNSDCIYSGFAYRLLEIYNFDNFELNEENLQKLKQRIRIDNKYQSFSKSYQFTKNYIENGDFGDIENSVIIKSNVNGLDINKFIDKYKENISVINTAINLYPEQEEVITQFSDFEIIYAFGEEI